MRPGTKLVACIVVAAALFVLSSGTVAKDTPGAGAEASSDVEGRLDFYRHVDSDRDGFVELDEVVNVSKVAARGAGRGCPVLFGGPEGRPGDCANAGVLAATKPLVSPPCPPSPRHDHSP